MNKELLLKVLDYWYMMDVMNQSEHPYENVTDYIRLKEKAEYKYKNAPLNKYVEIAITINSDQLRSDAIQNIIYDEIKCLNGLPKENGDEGYKLLSNITIYLGEISRENCLIQLAKQLNPNADLEARPEKMDSRLSLALLQIDASGSYVEGSLSISPVVWGISVLKSSKIKNASCLKSQDYLDAISGLDKKFKENSNSISDIWQILSDTWDYNTIAASRDNPKEFIIKCTVTNNTKDADTDMRSPNLSMAFYANDLALCRSMAESGKLSDMTANYIVAAYTSKDQPKNAVDLVRGEADDIYSQFDSILDVKKMPIGKWPSEFFPALMQQTAINLEIDRNNDLNIFSVNGPPGTGKTTLLKEIIVNNIVERARKIYEFTEKTNPDDMFKTEYFKHGDIKTKNNCKYDIYSKGWYRLKKEYDILNDYGIVVASCNNAAVENISKELPVDEYTSYFEKKEDEKNKKNHEYEKNTKLFSPKWCNTQMSIYSVNLNEGVFPKESNKKKSTKSHRDVYFSYYADSLLNSEERAAQLLEGYAGEINDKESHAWGLIAAPLGKQSNINKFYYSVLRPLVESMKLYGNKEEEQKRLFDFRKAREKFKEQLDNVLKLQDELIKLQEDERNKYIEENQREEAKKKLERTDYEAQINELDEEIERKIKDIASYVEISNINEQIRKYESDRLTYAGKLTDARQEMIKHEKAGHKTRFLGLRRKKAEEHLRWADDFRKQCDDLEVLKTDIEKKLDELKTIAKLQENLNTIKEKKQSLAKYEHLSKQEKGESEDWKKEINVLNHSFINDYLDKESDKCTKANTAELRVNKEYDREREKLFFYALQLNKHFVFSSQHLYENFKLLGQYWGLDTVQKEKGGDKVKAKFDKEDTEAFAPALFQSLLFLVPVISTTFASVGNMFRDVKEQNVIGTLIVDEAGQATPECAVGALLRSRRAMIVGDPKQVEPVVTDDLKLLRDSYDDEGLRNYKNSTISVQTFADSLNPYGTILADNDEDGKTINTWVGCPLVVHRRCISPMFDISNELSYEIMKNETTPPKKADEEKYISKVSCWKEIDGSEAGNKDHYVSEQGEEVARLIIESFRINSENTSIFVISPFTSVVRGMKNTIMNIVKENESADTAELRYRIEEWAKSCIGTVHKFQGKEAKEVFFLLGCDKTSLSAVKWVNKNIVNVAATRAKHRLYVIGKYDGVWENNSYLAKAYELIENKDFISQECNSYDTVSDA